MNRKRAEVARFIERDILDTIEQGLAALSEAQQEEARVSVLRQGDCCHAGARMTRAYGSGFAENNLHRMMQFAEVFPDEQIVVSLMRQLSWAHISVLLPLKQPLQRGLPRRDVSNRTLERAHAAPPD